MLNPSLTDEHESRRDSFAHELGALETFMHSIASMPRSFAVFIQSLRDGTAYKAIPEPSHKEIQILAKAGAFGSESGAVALSRGAAFGTDGLTSFGYSQELLR